MLSKDEFLELAKDYDPGPGRSKPTVVHRDLVYAQIRKRVTSDQWWTMLIVQPELIALAGQFPQKLEEELFGTPETENDFQAGMFFAGDLRGWGAEIVFICQMRKSRLPHLRLWKEVRDAGFASLLIDRNAMVPLRWTEYEDGIRLLRAFARFLKEG
jgi:hypothetical protein